MTLVLLLFAIGCSTGKVPVRGTVTFDGQAVEEGSITFDPADGEGPNTGGIIEDGRYELAGDAEATPGKKIVRIRASRKTGRKVEAGPPAPPGTLVDEVLPYIPAEYNTESTLTAELTIGKVNEFNFPLKSPGPAR